MPSFRELVREIHCRSVWQVLGVYLVASWVVLQVVDVLADNFGLPGWFPAFALGLLVVGLPVVIATAVVQEGGPGAEEGVPDRPIPDLDALGREDPGPVGGGSGAAGRGAEAPTGTGRDGAEGAGSAGAGPLARRLLTWRNALAGGVLALALWGVVAGGWLLLRGGPLQAPLGGEEALDVGHSVAVLPFERIGGADEATGAFVRGMHEGLLTELSKISDLTVVSRTSVERYADSDAPLPRIAQELGVSTVVEGSVQRAGDRVRLTVQLIDGDTDAHLWAEDYDRSLSAQNVFAIQSDLAQQIAGRLESELTPEERRRIEDVPTRSTAAYDLYVRGAELTDRSRADNRVAVELLRQALEADSSFALARAALANAYMHRAQDFGYPVAWYDSSLVEARRAVDMDPQLAEGHKEVATALMHLGRMDRAVETFRRAVELRPGYAEAMHNLGLAQASRGRWAEALRWYWRGLPTGPVDPYINRSMGDALHMLGQERAADAWLERMTELGDGRWQTWRVIPAIEREELDRARRAVEAMREWDPDHLTTLYWAGLVAELEGRDAEAADLYRRSYRQRTEARIQGITTRIRLAGLLREAGPEEATAARALLDEAERWNRSLIDEGHGRGPRVRLAAVHALRGQQQEAYRWLDSAYALGHRRHRFFRRDPVWSEIRDQERFQELLDRMEAALREEREKAVAWAADNGVDWPPLPEDAPSG